MKNILVLTACSLSLALASAVQAQSTAPERADGAAPTTVPGSAAPAPTTPSPAPAAPAPGAAPAQGAAAPAPEPTETISGWSVKNKIMGKAVYNDQDEKIGDINDVVLASDGKAAYFIVGAGGFLGMGERSVAIPYDKVQHNNDKMVLPGFTKDQLKALPKVEVAK